MCILNTVCDSIPFVFKMIIAVGLLLFSLFNTADSYLPFTPCRSRGGRCVREGRCKGWVDEWTHHCGKGRVCCRPHMTDYPPQQGETQCGVIPVFEQDTRWRARVKRVVGGDPAVVGEWPWQVALVAKRNQICGGSLVSSNWVITAAHCFKKYSPRSVRVVLGQHHKYRKTGNEETRRIARLVKDRRFTLEFGNAYDIALLKLDRPVDISGHYIRTICLPYNNSVSFDPDDHCYVTGWGNTKNTGDSRVLRHVQVNIVPNPECDRTWGVIKNRNICAGDGSSGACKGDSGGPLVCFKHGRYTLAGVTSWGSTTCQREGFPDVFTRVTSFLDWINNFIYLNK